MSEFGGVVILTPLDLEHKAVVAHLRDTREIWHPEGTPAVIGTAAGVPWPVAAVLTGVGNHRAAAVAERVSSWLRPRALLVVGIAGALREVELGDVVVATQVYSYHSGKETPAGFQPRLQAWRADYRLEQVAHSTAASDAWSGSLPTRPAVHFKPVAAGEVVLNSADSPLRAQLTRDYGDAVAIEMESAGAAAAARLNESLPVLTIRGISDHADHTKARSDAAGLQPAAAANAAAFAMAFLRRLPDALAPRQEPDPGQPDPGQEDTGLLWRLLPWPLPAVPLSRLSIPRPRGVSVVEVCLVPVEPTAPLALERLAALPAELARLGRAAALFGPGELVSAAGAPAVSAAVASPGAGLAITRRGMRIGWRPLPRDPAGSLLDPDDLTTRLSGLLAALIAAEVPHPREAAPAVTVIPALPLSEGRIADMPRVRDRGQTSLRPFQVRATHALLWDRIGLHLADISAELSARVLAAFGEGMRGAGL